MAQNRTIPYGYQIKNGKLICNEIESKVVRRIYKDYAEGKSYKAIAEILTAEGISYMPSKPSWNKNMVARILQNDNYLGNEKYPQIVEETLNHNAELAKKAYTPQAPKEIRAIKPFLRCGVCGGKINRKINKNGRIRWACENEMEHISTSLQDEDILQMAQHIQHQLMTYRIEPPKREETVNFEIARLQNEIDRLIENANESMEEIQSKVLALAQLRYSHCPDTTHLEESYIEELKKAPDKLNPELLGKLTESIEIIHTAISGVTLKNGLTIRKGEK